MLMTNILVSFKVGWRWVSYFLLSAKVQVMELSVSGRLKLADVLGGGMLVKLLTVLPGILCLICIFWLFQCKSDFKGYEGSYFVFVFVFIIFLIFSSLLFVWLGCENKSVVNL